MVFAHLPPPDHELGRNTGRLLRIGEDMVTDADLRHPDRRVTVATYEDYLTAQRAVDLLSDNKFPVDQVPIEDVRLVERARQLLAQLTPALQK